MSDRCFSSHRHHLHTVVMCRYFIKRLRWIKIRRRRRSFWFPNTRNEHLLKYSTSFAEIGNHSQPLVATRCHSSPFASTRCHSLPSIAIRIHSLPFAAIRYHSLPLVAIHCHSQPLAAIRMALNAPFPPCPVFSEAPVRPWKTAR